MKLCEGGRVATHEDIIHHEKACPLCVAKDKILRLEKTNEELNKRIADLESDVSNLEEGANQ